MSAHGTSAGSALPRRVVVVGGGLSGLSAAMRLSGAGCEVVVLEREQRVGGRAGRASIDTAHGTYRIDTGPSVLTMPELVEDCFEALGEQMADWLRLDPVEPAYQASFADGSVLDVVTDPQAMAAGITDFAGPRTAAGYLRWVDHVRTLYRLQMRDYIDRNLDSPSSLLRVAGARLVAAGGLRRLAPAVAGYLDDERVQRVFSFQSLYAGVSPQRALALYAVISYMDTVAGVWFPRGGMHALPTAMAAAAHAHGVDIRCETEVSGTERQGGTVTAVLTTNGDRIPCDALVLAVDVPLARRVLLDDPLQRKLEFSPSCWLMMAGSRSGPGGPEQPRHHTIVFGRAWRECFDELAGGRLMRDPSLLISRPTVTDPDLAPPGRHAWSVLVPSPHLAHRHPLRWDEVAPGYRSHVLSVLATRGYHRAGTDLEVDMVHTPADWAALGLSAGTPFSLAHTFAQTGPWRPSNRWGTNVALAGAGTTPGVGIPMVLISGRLAAERLLGTDDSYRSRAWP